MKTLAQATLALSEMLGGNVRGTATNGAATTVVDTARYEPDDYFTPGTIWMLTGNNAGKSAQVTTWNLAAHTFTFPTMTLLNAAGNVYAAATPDYPRWLLIQKINETLRELTPPDTDESLTTVANQELYTLPTDVYNVKRVEVAQSLTTPYRYQRNDNWEEIDGQIKFDLDHEPTTTGYKIRLSYTPPHTELTLDADTIADAVPLDLLVAIAQTKCLIWATDKFKDERPDLIRKLNQALFNENVARGKYKDVDMPKDVHLASW